MIDIFLKAKHWQVFLALVGLPLLDQIYSYYSIFWNFETVPESNIESEGFKGVLSEQYIQFEYFPFVVIIYTVLFFGWFWSMGIGLQKKIPSDIKMKVKKFKILFFIPLVYIVLIMINISGIFAGNGNDIFEYAGFIIAIMIPLHLLSMFCIFYTFYFVAKTIKTAEEQRKVGFSDFAGEFFLLWFYFIGIWIIQPKVNRLYQTNNTTAKNGYT